MNEKLKIFYAKAKLCDWRFSTGHGSLYERLIIFDPYANCNDLAVDTQIVGAFIVWRCDRSAIFDIIEVSLDEISILPIRV